MKLDISVQQTLEALEQRSARELATLKSQQFNNSEEVKVAAAGLMLDIGRDTGLLINSLIRSLNAKTVVEIGASVGYSTIWMAEAVRATGGKVYTFELEEKKLEELAQHLTRAGLRDYVVIGQDCTKVLPTIDGAFDLVLLDHWKEHYVREFDACWPKLRPGGLIIADNINESPCWSAGWTNKAPIERYVAHVRGTPDARSLTLDIGSGIEVTCKEEPS